MNSVIQSTNATGTGRAYQTLDNGDTYTETSGTLVTQQELEQLNQQYNTRFDIVDISTSALASSANEIKVKLVRETVYTKVTIAETGDDEVNTSGDVQYNNIRRIKPGFRTKYPFLGKFMHILVNMDFISSTLVNHIDEDGKLSVFDFIQDIMGGIQAATGHINNYKVVHNEDANMLYIQDYNIPPGQEKYAKDIKTTKSYTNKNPNMKPTKININLVQNTARKGETSNGQGSFVTDVQLKTELTNNFATQITVAAQANANKVGEDAVALSRLNIGYTDRIITSKSSRIDKTLTAENTLNAYVSNIEFRASLNAKINDGNINDNEINIGKQALVDLYKYEIGKFTKDENIPGIGFIPTNLNLTMDGISGIKLFESYTINDEILPLNYRNSIKFINRGVTHKIDDKGWITTLDSLGAPDLKSAKFLTKIEVIETPLSTTTSSPTNTENRNNITDNPPVSTEGLSAIRKRIVEVAQYWNSQNIKEIGSNQSFSNADFQAQIGSRVVGWDSGEHWCNFFTTLCYKAAYQDLAKFDSTIDGINKKYFNDWKRQTITAGYCPSTFTNFQNLGLAQFVNSTTQIYPGDMVTFNYNRGHIHDHIGIVVWYDKTKRTIGVIEGNSSDKVKLNIHKVDTGKVEGVIRPIETIDAKFIAPNYSYSSTR